MEENKKMENDIYVTPLSGRYASKEMNKLWSNNTKYSTWRKLWVALAETEKELGLNISQEQIDEMKDNVESLNLSISCGIILYKLLN